MRTKLSIGLAIIAALVIFSSVFVVEQTETAIVLQFKKPIRTIKEPGLKIKAPWEDVQYFDKRVLNYNSTSRTVVAGDFKRLEVNAYVKYRIASPEKFLQTVRSLQNLEANLEPILESSMSTIINEVPLNTLLTAKRYEIMNRIKALVSAKGKDYGIEIVDVRIIRAEFPEKNRKDIYLRMESERQREAKTLRAEGAEESIKIHAQADRERTRIISEAQSRAEQIKGEGDSEAGKIYAEAFSRDPEFYRFYRSMEAYKSAMNKENTSLVLSPNSEFLKYMK